MGWCYLFMTNTQTKGQIQDTLSKAITQFYAKMLGIGPKETRVHIVEDMVVVRLKGKLMPMEEKLLEHKQGIGMVKDLREMLHEQLTESLSKVVTDITGQRVISVHRDISTRTGDSVEIFILDKNYEGQLIKHPR